MHLLFNLRDISKLLLIRSNNYIIDLQIEVTRVNKINLLCILSIISIS